jgi:hypothetical protein
VVYIVRHAHWAKGSVWVLDGGAGLPRQARYLDPLPLHD